VGRKAAIDARTGSLLIQIEAAAEGDGPVGLAMVRAAPDQATSDTALRMACSNASGGWAPVIR
jgi:hypothetical protein